MRRVLQAAVLAGVLALTSGCALIDRAGTAAVVDGNRYTQEQLAADFVALDAALGTQDAPGTMDEINRNFITMFIYDQIVAKAADELGVEPNKETVGRLRRSLEKQLGSAQGLEEYAATRGIAPAQIWTVLRNSVLTTDIGAKLVGGTDTDAQGQAANAYLQEFAKTIDIEVAPRYGAWDVTQMAVGAPVDDLSKAPAATS